MAELVALNNELFGDDDDSDPEVEPAASPAVMHSTELHSHAHHAHHAHAIVVDTLSSIGGNRGIIANPHVQHDVPAGSLILAEAPMLNWEEADVDLTTPSGIVHAIHQLMQPANHSTLKVCQNDLYPQLDVFTEISSGEQLQQIKSRFLDDAHIESLLEDFPSLSEIKVLQLVAVLKHNGLSSGLYRNISMLNHSCDPNCIIFKPKPSSK